MSKYIKEKHSEGVDSWERNQNKWSDFLGGGAVRINIFRVPVLPQFSYDFSSKKFWQVYNVCVSIRVHNLLLDCF